MNYKNFLVLFLLSFSTLLLAQESAIRLKFYGFVRNDIYFNSRQNVESIDGCFHLFPKPIELLANKDKNATPQIEMLSVATRLGLDITGQPIFGANSSAKIEADFAGASTTYYMLRIRQAYTKLNWTNSELLIGQTWHPLFGSVMPTGPSLNAGAPFQPFNRSPQVRFKQNLNSALSLMVAASYQMQYLSQGPAGLSAGYLKNSLVPSIFVGIENKTTYWTSGVGLDVKTIKPAEQKITSLSGMAYTQFVKNKLQIKAKALWGENLSDYLMLSGYGVTDTIGGSDKYTNFNIGGSWLNIVYGAKIQGGIFLGLSQNFGTNKPLLINTTNNYTAYGYGFYAGSQLLLDRLVRVAPHVSYNLPNFKLGLEYDFTTAQYGKINQNGKIVSPENVDNHRIVASVSYLF